MTNNKAKVTFHGTDTETGPGVLETALAYTSALRMADNAILFKYTAKSVGMTHGIIPSFMAKPWGNVRPTPFLPKSHIDVQVASRLQRVSRLNVSEGSFKTRTRHVHVSLRDKNGRNIFAVSDDELVSGRVGASYDDTKFISQEAEWFLAGVLDGIADGASSMP